VHSSFRHVPNLISLMRVALVAPVALTLVRHQFAITLLLFCVAGASDGADGFLAKRFGWQSEFGAILDPAADKLLLVTLFLTLAFIGLVPLWLAAAAVGRDVLLVLGALVYRYRFGPARVRPSPVSKLNTLCQLAFVLAAIARAGFSIPPAWVVTALGAMVFATVVVSGIDYLLAFGRRAAAYRAALRTSGDAPS
jgi:cardiolipin synthase